MGVYACIGRRKDWYAMQHRRRLLHRIPCFDRQYNVIIKNNISIWDKVTIEDDCFFGPNVVLTHVTNPRARMKRSLDEFAQTFIKKGVTIGANATIVCGITIGRHAFIGAGAVVTGDIPAYALAYGNPARINGYMCECGEKIDFSRSCNCGRTYRYAEEHGCSLE